MQPGNLNQSHNLALPHSPNNPTFLLPVLLVSDIRNNSQIYCYEDLALFSSISYVVLGLIFSSFIHFELIFVNGVKYGFNIIFLHVVI